MIIVKHLTAIYDAVLNALAFFAAVLLVLLMLCVTVDVILRYFFDMPQFWVGELAEYSLLYITFAGTAWVLRKEGHVKIDILMAYINPRKTQILDAIASIVGILVCAVLTYYGVDVALDHIARGVYNPTLMEFPKGPLIAIIPIGAFLLFIQFIRRLFGLLKDLRMR
jgi:TRAP-type C4-dicarboxylate transport system permease small subunit